MSTTTTTIPPQPCEDLSGVSAIRCRCTTMPLDACASVTLKRPVKKGLDRLCRLVTKAGQASGKKQVRLTRRAARAARQTLAKVNGRAGSTINAGCRDELQAFCTTAQAALE
jgi:hypothetical protein